MKIRTALAAAGLATALAVGAGTAAFAATDPAGSTRTPTPEQVAERCAKVPALQERIDGAQAKAAAALTKLTEAKAKAEAEGRTRRAERLGKAIERVQQRVDKLAAHETRLQSWSAEHCTAA